MIEHPFKRLLSLVKAIRNPPFFLYRLFHYLRIFVPRPISTLIASCNINDYKNGRKNEIIISTYDGSCQAVHPDIIMINNGYWLCITPYPYGMEEYENPCVCKFDKLSNQIDCSNSPIAWPKKHSYGFHLSDPCIFFDGKDIGCLFRDTWRANGQSFNALCLSYYDKHEWSEPIMLLSSTYDPLLSPALLIDDNGYYLIYTALNNNKLLLREFKKDCQLVRSLEITCDGLPQGYSVWHISIVFNNNLDKLWCGNSSLLGVFLLRNGAEFKLYLASALDSRSNWSIDREVVLPDWFKTDVKIVYKSCFIPNTKELLVSFRDKYDRYRFCIVSY